MTFNMATANMDSSDACNGYFSSPVDLKNSYCAMRACPESLAAMNTCCNKATVMNYLIPADPHSNMTKGDFAAGFYCLIGDMTFKTWENCTSAQGVEAGICATGVEAYVVNGAGREGPGSLVGFVGLVMVLKAMIW
jgi:hypothetical protein